MLVAGEVASVGLLQRGLRFRDLPFFVLEARECLRFLTWRTFVHTLCTMQIEWDSRKADANLREHGVSFAEAATVLTDEYALSREDPDSIGEQCFVSLGMSSTGALLVVVYTHTVNPTSTA